MNQLINSRWTKLTLPYKLSDEHCTLAFPISPNYLYLINPKEKEMFLVQAIVDTPRLKSLGIYEFRDPWCEEGEGWFRWHRGWEFNSKTIILSLENDQGEKSAYKLDIPYFENAQLFQITLENNESLINKDLVCNIQRLNFGMCLVDEIVEDNYNGFPVGRYTGLSSETNEFIQSKQVHVNCKAYVDGDYILVPKRSGEDAFYGGLDLYKEGDLVQSIDFDEISYVEVEKGQGIIFEVDESGQNAKSAIYFCIEFTKHEYEPNPVLECVVCQKDAFESIFFWGLSGRDQNSHETKNSESSVIQ